MIQTRTEKLRFIVEEMQVALHLATNLNDPFIARTIARHVLVRAENFIAHARQLRRPLRDAGFDTNAFHESKEAYAAQFDEYFKIARHRLGAHVQDLDFGKRIELWNDIEVVKLSYFVDGAREIYEGLSTLVVPGAAPYAAPAELSDPAILEILQTLQCSLDACTWVEMGSDSLAMTRSNTSAAINTTPIHARAAQLVLIQRWIKLQLDLRQRFHAYPAIERLLKARLVTDLVSYCDCLVTRQVTPGALQAMDGLDKLVHQAGQSSAPVSDFVAASHFAPELASSRSVRDAVGAHLEIDAAKSLESLLADLDAFDFEKALAFHQRVTAAFEKLCFSILFLRIYANDGARIYGIAISSSSEAKPFAVAVDRAQQTFYQLPSFNDCEAYRTEMAHWLDGDDSQKGTAREFFFNAFTRSDILAKINEVELLGSGQHYHTHNFLKAHQFILDTLNDGLSDFEFKGVLELVLSCRSGFPYPLAEVLVRYGQTASIYQQYLICHVLGEIASAPHQCVADFLIAQSLSPTWAVRLQSVTARYKSFVKNEGLFRTNHKGQTKVDFDVFVAALTNTMTPYQRLVCLLAFASVHTGPLAGVFTKPFDRNYTMLQSEIENLSIPLLKDDALQSKATLIGKLIQVHDYVGVCFYISTNLEGGKSHPLFPSLVDSCCEGVIITAAHDQARQNLIMSLLLKNEHRLALTLAKQLAARNPDRIETQILVAQILSEIVGAETEASAQVSGIRNAYKLSSDHMAILAAVEAEVHSRQAHH